MNILLIYPNVAESPKDISLKTIFSILKKNNHEVELMSSQFKISLNKTIKKITTFNPDLVVITTPTNDSLYNAINICNLIKKIKNVHIICGGYHATISPENIISQNCFDIVAIGKAESSFLKLIKSLEVGRMNNYLWYPYPPSKKKHSYNYVISNYKINNLWFKKDGKIIKNRIVNN